MDLEEVKKLLDLKSFEEVKTCLSEHGVPVIEHYVDDRSTFDYERKFDLIVKNIFGISNKNKVHNINNFILGIKVNKEKNVHFSINRLHLNDYDLSPSIIIKYVKNTRLEEMMEPLTLLFSNRPASESFKFTKNNDYSLNIIQFRHNKNVYEILEPCAALQKPVYGLLHYCLINKHSFYYNSFNVDNCNTSVLDDNHTASYMNFFKRLEMPNYEYELINDKNDKYKFYLKFYRTENEPGLNKERQPLISLYLINSFYDDFSIKNEILEKLLDIVYESEQYIQVSQNSDEMITIKIGDNVFKIENSYVLLKDIFEDLTSEQKHILKRIYYFLKESFVNYTKDGVITSNNYYDGYYSSKNRNMIVSMFKRSLLR